MPASCSTQITQGQTKVVIGQVMINQVMGIYSGTSPYNYKFYVDGVLKHESGYMAVTLHSFNYTFNESIGQHTYKIEIIDSCSPAATVDSSQCVIDITGQGCAALSCPSLLVDGVTCPTSILTGLHILDINPSGGQAPYSYTWYIGTTAISNAKNPSVDFGVGTFNVSVNVTDSCSTPQTCSKICTLNVSCAAIGCSSISVDGVSCPSTTISPGVHTLDVNPSGGTAPYTYEWFDGATLISTAKSPGVNITTGTHSISVTVRDSCITKQICGSACTLNVGSSCQALSCGILCPAAQVQQGATASFGVNYIGGVAPFTIQIYDGGNLIETTTTSSSSVSVPHTFNESIGPHSYTAKVTDSCSSVQTCYSTCNLTVVAACPQVVCNLSVT